MFNLFLNRAGEKKELFGIEEAYIFDALENYFEIQVSSQDQEIFNKCSDQNEKLQILNKYCIAEFNLEEDNE